MQNEPPAPQGPDPSLSERQLVAARLLAWGRGPVDVARELGVSRQALWKWRGNAIFAGEVRRIHERISVRPIAGAGGLSREVTVSACS